MVNSKYSKGGSAPASTPANVATNGNNLILQPTSQVTPNQSAAQLKVTNVQLQSNANSKLDNVEQKGGKKSKRKRKNTRRKKRKNTRRNKRSRR